MQSIAALLIATVLPPKATTLNLSESTMNLLADRISMPLTFFPFRADSAVHSRSTGGDAFVSGTTRFGDGPPFGFATVAKFQNAHASGVEALLPWMNGVANKGGSIEMDGVWRFWSQDGHGVFSQSVTAKPSAKLGNSALALNHVFEVAPVLSIKTEDGVKDLRPHVRWIPGFADLSDKLKTRRAFGVISLIVTKATLAKGMVQIKSGPASSTYLGFTALCTTPPPELPDGYALEADIYDQDGDGLPGDAPLYPKMRLLLPKGTQGTEHINTTLGQRIRVFGMPRLSLYKLRPALNMPKHAFWGPLPVEIVVLGSLEFK